MPESSPKVFISSDHRGFTLRKELCTAFPEFIDLGSPSPDPNDDYNDAAIAVAKNVLKTPGSFGVLICGSAVGISIQANRFKGIRAAIVDSEETARLSRAHNNANIICLSADKFSTPEKFSEVSSALRVFLKTPFSAEERHLRRVKKLDFDYNLEEN